MSLTIYTYPNNHRVWKSLIAAEYNGVSINVPNFEFGKDNKTPEFLKNSPLGKVPVLVTPQGAVWESNAIAKYVARTRADTELLGASFLEQAQVDQWLDFLNNEVDPTRGIWLYPVLGIFEFNPQAYAEAKKDMSKVMSVLNAHLLHNTYLVGNKITLADIGIVSSLVGLYTTVFSPAYIKDFANVNRWFQTCVHQTEFAKVIGAVELAKDEKKAPMPKVEKPAVNPKAAAAMAAKAAGGAAAAKPAAKPAEKKEDLSHLMEEAEKAPKKKNPLDDLPPSTMIMDAVKKLYFLKKPFNPEFFDEFWKTFDAEGYSIWEATYKYPEELTSENLAVNLLDGFLSRCDSTRKYTFAVLHLDQGADGKYVTSGIFMFRGLEVIAEMKDVTDYEEYDFKRLSHTADKDRIISHFQGEKFDDKEVLVKRYFK